MCSIFSKATQPFDFIKTNIIRKLAFKVKCISQINGGLISFFRKFANKIFKITWLDCEYFGKNQYKKKEHNQQFSVQSVMITFILGQKNMYVWGYPTVPVKKY